MARKAKTRSDQPGLYASSVPQMPEGYYSGDQPNPNLRAFVEAHMVERPYDPATDDYDVPALNQPIETTKGTALYNIHSYWSKKPHEAIRQYIRHHTLTGDLVLDPFCGSGSTGIAALLDGRKTIMADLSPAATFIAAISLNVFACRDFDSALEQLEQRVEPFVDSRFRVAGFPGVARAVVYTERFRCSRCFRSVAFLEAEAGDERHFRGVTKAKEGCPHCGEPIQTNTDDRLGFVVGEIHFATDYRTRRVDAVNVLLRKDVGELFPVRPEAIPPHLRVKLEGHIQPRLWKNLGKAGAVYAADLFSDANLSVLLEIESQTEALKGVSPEAKDLLRLCLHAILYNCTRMYRHRTHTAGGGGFSGTYYIPHLSKCINPWSAFLDKCEDIKRAIKEAESCLSPDGTIHAIVSTESADQLVGSGQVKANSVDYIFTDPPYGGTYHYGALNFLWEAWYRSDQSWRQREITITEDGVLTFVDWESRMRMALSDAYAVLKPGRWISLCFHGEAELWQSVNDIMAEIGFVPSQTDQAIFIDTTQKSYNQRTGTTVKKRDLVISFRKPKPGELSGTVIFSGDEDVPTFNEKSRDIIRDYLLAHPGATKDRIYDDLVSRMISAGQMQAHNFDELLAQIAEPAREPVMKNLLEAASPDLFGTHEIVRWYLRETETALGDAAESAKEDAAAEGVGRFIARKLAADAGAEGVHYSDIWEHYVYTVKDKPRRHLADWLADYFFQTETGTYRLPATEEERKVKAEGRAAGTSRLIRRYLAYLQQGASVPERERPSDATLAEWIRHCKRAGSYGQGKILYEKGGLNLDALPEETMVNVEEDYQVCVRMLARAGAVQPGKRSQQRA